MKKMIALMLACCVVFGASACGNGTNDTNEVNGKTNTTNETSTEKNTSSANNTLLDDDYYNYGIKALEAVDQYLDNEIEFEKAHETIKELKEKISENDKSGIYSLISLLGSNLENSNKDLEMDGIKKYRDYLAGFLAKTLRYNETALPTFNITGNTFINQLNMILEETDPTLVLGNFEKKEISEGAIKEIYYLFTTDTGISVRYIIDKETGRLAGFTVSTDIQNLNENVFLDIGSYFAIANVVLNLDTTIDEFEENLHLSDFETKDYFMYNTEEANYSKFISDTQLLLKIYPN